MKQKTRRLKRQFNNSQNVKILLCALMLEIGRMGANAFQTEVRATTSLQILAFTNKLYHRPAGWPLNAAISNKEKCEELCLRFSHSFQRHVVYRPGVPRKSSNSTHSTRLPGYCTPDDDCDDVLASFLFLDEAQSVYPEAKLVPLPEACFDCGEPQLHRAIIAGSGLMEQQVYKWKVLSGEMILNEMSDNTFKVLMFLASLAWSCNQELFASPIDGRAANMRKGRIDAERGRQQIAAMLVERVGKRRFLCHTEESIRHNYNRLMDLLTRGKSTILPSGLSFDEAGARRLIATFPQICLYDYDEVEERVNFFFAPLPPSLGGGVKMNSDWPRTSNMGFGAGLTMDQATKAVQAVPQLLAMHHDDALKPSILYFYETLRVPFDLCDEARIHLDEYLTGATLSDVSTFAYMRYLGVDWDQMRLLIDAFPTLVFCDLEPSWELLEKGPIPSKLKETELHYLRKRLQASPSEILGMLKTHSRLSTYSAINKVKPTLDAIQSRIGFSSAELRKLVLRMPSLIGMSVKAENAGINERLKFFFDEVGMSSAGLRKAILRQPSLLQYGVESTLRPKVHFLRDELDIPMSKVVKIIEAAPSIMGLSLSGNIVPKVQTIRQRCGLSQSEAGTLISRAPAILCCSLQKNIKPTFEFLENRMNLSVDQVRDLVLTTPRVLLHSVNKSLTPKLDLIQEALERESKAKHIADAAATMEKQAIQDAALAIVIGNPSLLVTTNDILQRRLEAYMNDAGTLLSDAILARDRRANSGTRVTSVTLSRRKRQVIEVAEDSGEVLGEVGTVKDAADMLGVSVSNMYNAVRNKRLIKKRMFVYKEAAKSTLSLPSPEKSHQQEYEQNANDQNHDMNPALISTGLVNALLTSKYQTSAKKHQHSNSSTIILDIFVAGRVYPPDNMDQVRGTRRAGGQALYFPQVYYGFNSDISTRLRQAAQSSFGQIMPTFEGGSNFTDGLILAGFPYLRPSRNRCSLYACHDALKVILQLLKQEYENGKALQNIDLNIRVYTESDYAWRLLQNNTRLMHWGSFNTLEDFRYEGEGPKHLANPDLLWALSRTYYKLVNNVALVDKKGMAVSLVKNLTITYHHISDRFLDNHGIDENTRNLPYLARRAANWYYNRAKTKQ